MNFVYECGQPRHLFSQISRAQGRGARVTAIDFSPPPRPLSRAERVNCEAGRPATLISRPRPDTVDPHISVFIAFRELNIVARIQYCSALYYCAGIAPVVPWNQLHPYQLVEQTSRDPRRTLLRGVMSAFIFAHWTMYIAAPYNLQCSRRRVLSKMIYRKICVVNVRVKVIKTIIHISQQRSKRAQCKLIQCFNK